MIVLRTAVLSDLAGICQLAANSHITTLPNDPKILAKRLQQSCDSFNKTSPQPSSEYYLFVLEDLNTAKLLGTSAIEAYTGYEHPFYSYKLEKITQTCSSLKLKNSYSLLKVSLENQAKSELCTLFLEPHARKHGNGLLLSRSRFLFIAEHPQRFTKTIIAEVRGVCGPKGPPPFWTGFAKRFFPMSFAKADRLTMATDRQFITDLLPHYPIYTHLLSTTAQKVIGQPHPSSMPAMKILLSEGFTPNGTIDIFDGGPTVEASRDKIKTVKQSRVISLASQSEKLESSRTTRCFIANTRLDFRATLGQIELSSDQRTGILDAQTTDLLQVRPGDSLRIIAV